jgi:hypothetical protein
MPTATVCANDRGERYVEAECSGYTFQYRSDELPSEGTEVEVETYMGIGDVYCADITWTDFESRYHITATGW